MPFKILPLITILFASLHATPCESPAVADDNLSKKFHYGCFCGESYPDIKHKSKKSYRVLNDQERQELIEQYQSIDAYDDVDKACKVHDICFIQHAKQAKVCNDNIVKSLTDMKDKFSKEVDDNVTNAQCRDLAFDISSVFHTVFSPADDEDTIFDFGMLMFNGAITAMNKIGQETADTFSYYHAPRYPAKGVKCLVENLKKTKEEKVPAPQKVIVKTIDDKNYKDKTKVEPSFTLDVSDISIP